MDRNEEKLKILQERLRQIKEKDENISSSNKTINESITNKNIDNYTSEKSGQKVWVAYVALLKKRNRGVKGAKGVWEIPS